MDFQKMEEMDQRIKSIKKTAEELKDLAKDIPAVNRNVDRILASVKMLELNISDLL
jgi:hypothetical protein